jgi:hypothetical protein
LVDNLSAAYVLVARLPHLKLILILRLTRGQPLLVLYLFVLLGHYVGEGVDRAQVTVASCLVVDGVVFVAEVAFDVFLELLTL